MTVASRGPGGMPTRQTSSFTTLIPASQTQVYLTPSATRLWDGGTYGVGMIVVAHFDEPIGNKAAAERHLRVSTEPQVRGSWYWTDDQTAHWRPEKYYAQGTKLDVTADLYGADLGDGRYGQQDARVGFTIGDSPSRSPTTPPSRSASTTTPTDPHHAERPSRTPDVSPHPRRHRSPPDDRVHPPWPSRTTSRSTGLAIANVIKQLRPLRSATIASNGVTETFPPEIPAPQRKILSSLGIPEPGALSRMS